MAEIIYLLNAVTSCLVPQVNTVDLFLLPRKLLTE